jgi:hypothetical protein
MKWMRCIYFRNVEIVKNNWSPTSTPAVFLRGEHSNSLTLLDSRWNVMAHGDAQEGKWRGNWRMEWVASTLHTTSEHGVSSITTADTHTSDASSQLNWRPCWFKWTRPFHLKTKSGSCACAVTVQLAFTSALGSSRGWQMVMSGYLVTKSVNQEKTPTVEVNMQIF